jgi:hypothetical protein
MPPKYTGTTWAFSAVVSRTDNPSEWFEQKHIGSLRLSFALSFLRKPVLYIPATGFPFCQELLDEESSLGVLVFKPIPSFHVFPAVQNHIDAFRCIGPEVSVGSVPSISGDVIPFIVPELPGITLRPFEAQIFQCILLYVFGSSQDNIHPQVLSLPP